VTRRLVPLLLAVSLLLALALAALWFGPGPLASWRAWHAPEPQPPNLDDVRAALLTANPAAAADYPETLARPLLLPARRPAAAASEAAPPAEPLAIEKVKFTGIIDGPALVGVLLEEDGQPRFLRQGEAIGDWRLDTIEGRTLTFKRGSQSRQIDLPYADMGESTAKPPLGAPPGPPPPPARPPRRQRQ
jgi:hypothetical protein